MALGDICHQVDEKQFPLYSCIVWDLGSEFVGSGLHHFVLLFYCDFCHHLRPTTTTLIPFPFLTTPSTRFVSFLSSSFVQMIVVVSALRKEQMKSEEIFSLENELGRDWKRRKEFYKIRKNMERGDV